MENINIWIVLLNLLWIVLGFAATYFKTRTNVIETAVKKINEAESKYAELVKAGSIKQEFVVNCIYEIIPAPMKLFFTKEVIRSLVQQTFDTIQSYAYQQLDKVFNKDKEEAK